jgi:low temperature requirement protein LtrA
MSTSPTTAPAPIGHPLRVTMRARSPHEAHRAATPLELFFDLIFVVAIAQAAGGLHHAIAEAHALEGLAGYLMVLFAIWWAWMNFTWFASAYDCDDVPYRGAVFVQMAGALIFAAGVPEFFEARQPNGAVLTGYVVMRLAMVVQWLRAAAADPERRTTARRYAAGIAVLQTAWVATPVFPEYWVPAFLTLVALELAVPAWAERAAPTPWHPHHIAERYGLLTIIVLGESILAATVAVEAAWQSGGTLAALGPIVAGGLLIVYGMWWIYFDAPAHEQLTSMRRAFLWGYGHYVLFAAAAAVGAGLAVAVDHASHHAEIDLRAAGAAVAVPAAIYLIGVWVLHDRPGSGWTRALGPLGAAAILLTPLTGHAVPLTGLVLSAIVALTLAWRRAA